MSPGETVLECTVVEEEPERVLYSLDGAPVGEGDAGFSAVLRQVRELAPGSTLIVRYPLRVPDGGQPFDATLPFAARREELDAAAGERRLSVRFEMV